MANTGKIFRAVESFFADGVATAKGTLVREGHAILKGKEALFEEIKPDLEVDEADVKAEIPKVESQVSQAVKDAKNAAK